MTSAEVSSVQQYCSYYLVITCTAVLQYLHRYNTWSSKAWHYLTSSDRTSVPICRTQYCYVLKKNHFFESNKYKWTTKLQSILDPQNGVGMISSLIVKISFVCIRQTSQLKLGLAGPDLPAMTAETREISQTQSENSEKVISCLVVVKNVPEFGPTKNSWQMLRILI